MFQAINVNQSARPLIIVALALLLSLTFATPASAGEGIEGDPDAIVPEDVTIEDDLFIVGEHVRIDGNVLGDVFAAGQEVVINGTVDGNLFVAGQLIKINGEVAGSVFSGAYSLEVGENAQIAGSVYFGGFSLSTATESRIVHGLYMGGYQLEHNGAIGRDLNAGLGAFQFNGQVDGDVYFEISQSDGDFGSSPNDFTYYMPGSVEVLPSGFSQSEDAVVAGELDYRLTRIDSPNFPRGEEIGNGIVGAYFGNLARARIGEFVALLLVGALVFYALPRQANLAVEEIRHRPVANLGWGVLVALLAPLALLLSIVLVIFLAILLGSITLGSLAGTALAIGGSSLALFWALAGLLFWMVSKALFAYLLGRALFERVSPAALDGRWAALLSLLVGLLLYELVRAIPVFGFLLAGVVILIGIGAIVQVLLAARRSRTQTA